MFLIVFTLILPEKHSFHPHGRNAPRSADDALYHPRRRDSREYAARAGRCPARPLSNGAFSRVSFRFSTGRWKPPERSPNIYPRLGFDPDYLMYRSSMFPFLEGTCGMSRQEIARVLPRKLSLRGLESTLGLRRKVATQLAYFVFPDQGTFFRPRIKMGKLYEYALETLPANLDQAISEPVKHLYEDYRRGVSEQTGRDVNLDAFRPLRQSSQQRSASAIWIEIAFLISWVSCLLFRSLAPCRLPGFLALVFFLAPGGNAMTVALVHALDNSRYRGSLWTSPSLRPGRLRLFLRGYRDPHDVLSPTAKPCLGLMPTCRVMRFLLGPWDLRPGSAMSCR